MTPAEGRLNAAVARHSVICQECKYARHNLSPIAAECKAIRHKLDRSHLVFQMADGIQVKAYHPTVAYKGNTAPF